MSIQPQHETYRYTGEIARLHSQSMVECRLPGSEIGSVLAVHATAVPQECACADGEVRYGGKLLLSVLYEDGDRNICRAERGAEFFHKAEGAVVTPACFAKIQLSAANVSTRREGSGLYVSVVIDAESIVYGSKQMEYVSGGEGIVVRKEEQSVCKCVCVSGETEGEDVFDADYVGDVLMHSEKAIVTHVRASAGQIDVEGELAVSICVLKADNSVCSYERLIPIRMQIPSEEAFGALNASARVKVKSAQLNAGVDEEKGRSKIEFVYCLSADCFLYAKDSVLTVADAFSPLAELTIEKANDGGRYLTNCVKYTERVSGVCSLTPSVEGDYVLAGAILPCGEATVRKTAEAFEIEGLVQAEVLLKSAEAGYKTCTLALPFVFPVDAVGEEGEVDVLVCGLNVRRKKDGQTEAEATLKLCLRVYETVEWTYVREVQEGAPREEKTAALSMYALREGEELWTVAKRLACDPEELKRNNPTLEFPVKKGENIFIYRQIK